MAAGEDQSVETAPGSGESGEGAGIPAVSPAPAPRPSRAPASGPINEVTDSVETGTPFGPTTGIAHPIPVPKKQAEWDEGYQNEHGPRPSRWDAWVSGPFNEAAHSSVASPWGGALLRMAQEQGYASGKTLSADQANQLYPGRPVPYTTSVDQGTAMMEYNDRQKQQQLSDWIAQRPSTVMGKVVSTAAGFVGGMTDPLNFAIGAATSGVSELLAPEAAGIAGKVAAHYLGNLGGFTATDALQNLIEHQMGAKQKQFGELVGENVVPAAIMSGVGLGLGALARRFVNEGGGASETDIRGIKETVAKLEQDQRPPQLEDQRAVLDDRRAGVSYPAGPGGDSTKPTLMTSPMQETQLYAAAHSDGTPLVHEHGLGPGVQLTDSYDVANNGVSRSSETPGQIAESSIPKDAKLLDIDQTASEAPEIAKAIEKATGIPLDQAESLKDAITKLGDWSGAEVDGHTIPENILQQIQEIAKSQGYDGYGFSGENSRQAHMFDPNDVSIGKASFANPAITPQLPEPAGSSTQMESNAEPPTPNPGLDRANDKTYSPEIEKLVHDFRKGKTFDPYSPEALADVQKDVETYKQQLTDLSKDSASAREALEDLRKSEVQDARLKDIAKRIAECGQGGGL